MRVASSAVALRRPLAALAVSPHLRRRLLLLLGALLPLACIYLFWIRDSGFVRVERVSITGISSSDPPQLREELTAAAQTMTTLHVSQDRLDRVAASYPAVERLKVSTDFPHGLRIRVIEFQPAAILLSGSSRVPVARDGRLLRALKPDAPLPVIKLQGALPAERLRGGFPLRAVTLTGAAPAPLRHRITGVRVVPGRGLVARLRSGPDLIFGDLSRLRAKWLAAARVLADSASHGATYLDLRLPERPAAGGLPVAPAATDTTSAPAQAPAVPPVATTPQTPPATRAQTPPTNP